MSYYSIEVCYKYPEPIKNIVPTNTFPHDDKNSESYEIKIELENLSNKYNGEMSAFDYDFMFNVDDNTFDNISSVNYNYNFNYIDDINNFISNLPVRYEILWIHRNDKKKKCESIECRVYSSEKKPEVIKFNDNDKLIYKNILDRIKNTQN